MHRTSTTGASSEKAIVGFGEISFNEARGLKTLLFTGTSQKPKNGVEIPGERAATIRVRAHGEKHTGMKKKSRDKLPPSSCVF